MSLVEAKARDEMQAVGYTVFPKVFSTQEMAELEIDLDRFEQRMHDALVEQGGASGISRAGEITFTDHIAERDEAVRAFVSRPEFVEITTAFLGPDVDLYWNQTVFKHPESDKEFPWHQDDAYTPVTPAPYLTLWLAINDATLENGCVSVLPGSYLKGLQPHEWTSIGFVGYSKDEEDQGVPVPVSAGSIVCFWSLTFHRSAPNRSKGIRKAYVIQYSQAGLRYAASGDLVQDLLPIAREGEAVG